MLTLDALGGIMETLDALVLWYYGKHQTHQVVLC